MLRVMSALAILLGGSGAAMAGNLSAAQGFIKDRGITRYRIAYADLNDDGRTETLVYAYDVAGGGDADLCGSGGCDLFVLHETGDAYEIVGDIGLAHAPIRVLPSVTHGWHDLGVRVSGGGIGKPFDARLRYDGMAYPGNPTLPAIARLKGNEGRIVIGAPSLDTNHALYELIARLDLTSFPNSVGPRRQAGKIGFADYGFTRVEEGVGGTTLYKPDFSWSMSVRILGRSAKAMRVCFTDIAHNGGSYRTQTALSVKTAGERWTAHEVKGGFDSCGNDPSA